ncbi:hypothetical protein, partial [Klebsiella pneumoniae]|uniref:hypothetical protein n=1 Tax=Klebsiella pneumoniae TaxID=573 RepID=UPI002E7916D0
TLFRSYLAHRTTRFALSIPSRGFFCPVAFFKNCWGGGFLFFICGDLFFLQKLKKKKRQKKKKKTPPPTNF